MKQKKNQSNNKKKTKAKRLRKSDMLNAIMRRLEEAPHELFNYKQMSAIVGATNQVQKIQVASILSDLAFEDVIQELDRGRYRLKSVNHSVIEGTFQRRSNGKNAFIPDGDEEAVFVADRNAARAMDGDRVKVRFLPKRKGKEREAEVVEIVERKERILVGKLQINKGLAFLITEDKTLANDIFIPNNVLKGGKNGDKAIVRIKAWHENTKNPEGEVVDILGKAGQNNAEMHAILAEYGLPYVYPLNVEAAANKISEQISAEERLLREDFRDVPTMTIDPKDAKDFDDALSARLLENGNWEIGVHIADVTHYVKPESVMDREAQKRATSVYLVDRTIPMLPERLCNQICSLRPNEEKCAFSVIFEINEKTEVVKSRICRTVINSDRRFTYEEAQEVIETKAGDFQTEILTMNAFAQKLRERRFKAGAINFERWEVKFDIDETGKPIRAYFRESKEAHKLVEEFMLLANRTVAEFVNNIGKTKKTFVYRIHDKPDPEKIENFATLVRRFGHSLKTDGTNSDLSQGINKLLSTVHGAPEENLISTVAIRAMQKARYTTENIGHYGLAFPHYTHFTSPIRRYPDMMVHRLLERYLAGGRSLPKAKYEELCEHCSSMELVAANAERASIKYKQVEFMSDKLGQVFDGVISGVTEWGIYVELNENKCEGLVPMRDLDDDYYEFDEKNYCLIGRKKKHMFRLGDPLSIRVAQANLERKQLDFQLAPHESKLNSATQ